MSAETKKKLKSTFLNLLEERPLAQISVKDIVSECGVNRNTFYYHYADLPALIEEIITEEVDRIAGDDFSFDTIGEFLENGMVFILSHKKAVNHLYNSVNRDILVHYFMQISEKVISGYMNNLCRDRNILPEDKEMLTHYFKCMIFGEMVDWIMNGMTKDLIGSFERFCSNNKGLVEEMVDRVTIR
ncbi:MAG: TetR/AcrR family transcriptional regulator [Clostridiales bacterium]|nr:TetR/AcrR family transcriptional regulator [Clostridiales bacterium]